MPAYSTKERGHWFNICWPYDLRESPDWQINHPRGPVHFDIRDDLSKAAFKENIPANELRAQIKLFYKKLNNRC